MGLCKRCKDTPSDKDTNGYCHRCLYIVSKPFMDYNEKLVTRFFAAPMENTKLFFGVELEVNIDQSLMPKRASGKFDSIQFGYILAGEHRNPDGYQCDGHVFSQEQKELNKAVYQKYSEKLVNNFRFISCKHDGSVGFGFEIVTDALSWGWINENKDELKRLSVCIKENNMYANENTCGMHIHISKSAFTSLHLFKFMKFFYSNQQLICLVSQRGGTDWSNKYCSFSHSGSGREDGIKKLFHNDARVMSRIAKSKSGIGKKTAINLINPDTVEIRTFVGTTFYSSIRRNIEFIKSVYDFTKIESILNMSNDRYIKYLGSLGSDFSYIKKYLKNVE